MTTHSGRPFAVDDEMDEDADPAASQAYTEERGDAESDVIVAAVIDEEPGSRAGGYEPGAPYNRHHAAAADGLFPAAATTGPAGQQGIGALGQQWHDIQVMFVDDPRGSVQVAAEAADAAVSSLVVSLRERQNGTRPAAGSASSDPAETEQLRGALRTYRAFCETLRDLAQRLPQVGDVAR